MQSSSGLDSTPHGSTIPRPMTTDVPRDVIDDVRGACARTGRSADEVEVRRALAALSPAEQEAVQRLARGPAPAKPLGPDAFVDIMRGLPADVAAARELGGYYQLRAERDVLATIARAQQPESAAPRPAARPAVAPVAEPPAQAEPVIDEPSDEEFFDEENEEREDEYEASTPDFDEEEPEYEAQDDEAQDDEAPEYEAPEYAAQDDEEPEYEAPEYAEKQDSQKPSARVRYETAYSDDADPASEYEVDEQPERPAPAPRRPRAPAGRETDERVKELVTLFAYHRDGVLVAQALGIGIQELNDRIEDLGMRRKLNRLLEQTTDIDLFTPERLSTAKTKSVPAPVVRRRGEKPATPPLEPESHQFDETDDDRPMPSIRTAPVNEHGTRVYRRVPEARPMPTPATGPVVGRREYVRETRRRSKPAPTQTQHAQPLPAKPLATTRPLAAPGPSRRPFSDLQADAGRSVLEKLIADEKANPRVLAKKLAERYEGPAQRELNETDLRQLLRHHGLLETFQSRETSNTRFLIGFHQGARGKLANALLMTPEEFAAYLARLGLSEELETTRQTRARIELGRKRLHDRIVQVLTRAPYLDDLGVLGPIDREVREAVEALFLRFSDLPRAEAAERVREELGLEKNGFAKLLRRYELTGQ